MLARPWLAVKSITTAWVSVAKLLVLLAAMKASKLGLRTVSVTATAWGDAGRPQLDAEPPCGAKLLKLAATGNALPPTIGALYGDTVPLRVSRMRHGTMGVYTRSWVVSPSAVGATRLDTAWLDAVYWMSAALDSTSRSPESDPATLAASN